MTRNESGFIGETRALPKQQDRKQGTAIPSSLSDEVSIGDIARYIRDAFPRVLVGALVAGSIGVALVIGSRLLIPSVNVFRTALVITMPGAEEGKYTNGSAFALTDLKSPAVLDEVFQNNRLSDYGITLSDFLGMISVETYAPAFDSIAERFRTRLDDKALTFEEKKLIEAEFQQAIGSLRSKSAIVSLSLPESAKVPESVAQKVVDDIPADWASLFVDRLGVANLPVPVSGSNLIDKSFLASLDFPIAYDYLDAQSAKLRNRLLDIAGLPGAISFVSQKNGKGIADLQREAEAIDQYRMRLSLKPLVDQGLSKDPTVTVLIYKNKINDLQKDAAVQAEYSGKVNTVINDFRSNKTTQSATSTPGSATPAIVPGPQFDGAFIDRIIDLSKQGGGVEFEQGLLQKKLELENLNVNYSDQMRRLTERRDAIINNALPIELRKSFEEKFIVGVEQAATELNKLWESSYEFLSELNTKRLNNDKALYRLSELPSNLRMEKPSLLTRTSALIFVAASFFGALAGFASFAWRRALQSR